jgi:hypothetical protein
MVEVLSFTPRIADLHSHNHSHRKPTAYLKPCSSFSVKENRKITGLLYIKTTTTEYEKSSPIWFILHKFSFDLNLLFLTTQKQALLKFFENNRSAIL